MKASGKGDEEPFIDPQAESVAREAGQRGRNISSIDAMFASKVTEAKAGDRQAALWILNDFVGAVRNNTGEDGRPLMKPSGLETQFHEDAIRYLADCFKSILEGVPADKALGINKGEPGANALDPKKKSQREYEWCLYILHCQSSGKYSRLADAQVATARKFNVSLSAIQKAWKRPAPRISARLSFSLEKKGK